jgi:hypothetical protein
MPTPNRTFRIYLSGPMTVLTDYNYHAFEEDNESLRAAIVQAITADAYLPARQKYPKIYSALSEENWHMSPCKRGTATSARAVARASVIPPPKRSPPPPHKHTSTTGTQRSPWRNDELGYIGHKLSFNNEVFVSYVFNVDKFF